VKYQVGRNGHATPRKKNQPHAKVTGHAERNNKPGNKQNKKDSHLGSVEDGIDTSGSTEKRLIKGSGRMKNKGGLTYYEVTGQVESMVTGKRGKGQGRVRKIGDPIVSLTGALGFAPVERKRQEMPNVH